MFRQTSVARSFHGPLIQMSYEGLADCRDLCVICEVYIAYYSTNNKNLVCKSANLVDKLAMLEV